MSRTPKVLRFRALTQAALCLGLLGAAAAGVQGPQGGGTTVRSNTVAPSVPTVPTFASIDQGFRTCDFTAVQLRRFRQESGNVVSVRERIEVDADGSANPPFVLTFLAVEGEPAGSLLELEWRRTYGRFAELFFRHGSFQIRDLTKTVANYSLHDFGPIVRANRSARRMVVYPNSMDKAVWVVDIDTQTSLPLFVAEFDSQMRLFGEIEVLSFTPTVQPLPASKASTIVTPMADFTAAQSYLGNPTGLIDPNVMVAWDYGIEGLEVREDPLNGNRRLVMTYTDGIDQFVVGQAIGAADPFAGLPSSGNGTAHTIARFRDPALSALVFWEDGVSFHVAGRGSLQRLDDVAKAVYLQALSTN